MHDRMHYRGKVKGEVSRISPRHRAFKVESRGHNLLAVCAIYQWIKIPGMDIYFGTRWRQLVDTPEREMESNEK